MQEKRENNIENFGDRLKNTLNRRGMSQKTLLELLDKSGKSVISNWINGRAKPSTDDAIKIAEILKVSLDWLLTGELNYDTAEDTVTIAKEEYMEYLVYKTEKLQKENAALKNDISISSK